MWDREPRLPLELLRGSQAPRRAVFSTRGSLRTGMTFTFFHFAAAAAKSLQSCLTLCDPMDCSLPGSSVPGILQARTLEWVAISFQGIFLTQELNRVSCIAGGFFTS